MRLSCAMRKKKHVCGHAKQKTSLIKLQIRINTARKINNKQNLTNSERGKQTLAKSKTSIIK